MPPQLEATGVHHQGDQKWKATDATTIKTKICATINGNIFLCILYNKYCKNNNSHNYYVIS